MSIETCFMSSNTLTSPNPSLLSTGSYVQLARLDNTWPYQLLAKQVVIPNLKVIGFCPMDIGCPL